MRPVRTAANRSKLFFRYFMDCQTPGKPGGGTTQTWDIAERAVRGIAELFSQHGLVRALGFCSEPEVAAQQAPLFRELAQQGFSQALHFQVRGYRAPGAKQDYDWQRDLSLYDYDEQKAVLTIAKDHWEQAMGMAAEDFGACCAQANDHTFPILAELGFRQSYCSVPGRYDPQAGHYWWGAFAHSHHTSAKSRLICGDLDLYEIPVTRDLQPIAGPRPRTWRTRDFRAESELGFEEVMRIAAANIEDMLMCDHPVLYIHVPTHNTWDTGDHRSPRRHTIEATIDAVFALAEHHGLELTPATMADIHSEADRLGAY